MRNSIVARVFGILIIAIVVGGLIGWWSSRGNRSPRVTTGEPPRVTNIDSAMITPSPSPPMIAVAPTTQQRAVITPANPTTPDEPMDWEEKLDEILVEDGDTNTKGVELLALMDKVDDEGKAEIAGHVVNLIDDKHFVLTAKYLTNAAVAEEISSVFMNDLYNRENSLKLPMVLSVAKVEKHPLQQEARDLLELYIEEDHGSDWVAWENAMTTWLTEHPDEQ